VDPVHRDLGAENDCGDDIGRRISKPVKRTIQTCFRKTCARFRTCLVAAFCFGSWVGFGQDLAPRAYTITPIGANALTVGYTYNTGSVFVDPSLPVEDLNIHFQTQTLSYYHTLALLGRSSNITLLFPYAIANAQSKVAGSKREVYRSGLADSHIRLTMNLKGGPAMSLTDFTSWHEKSLIGVSFTAVVPAGQYDQARLMNGGANRWSFKPEIGTSRRWGDWALDLYTGAWFFTSNSAYYPGHSERTQQPITVSEAHLTYYLKPGFWMSLDANFWYGGRSTVDGQNKADLQRDARAGATVAIPVSKRHTLKFSYARGTVVGFGGDYQTLSAAWQYGWLGKPQ
jgi:hypothetical protein